MMAEGSVGKQGLPITRDPGRVLRPGDPGFPEAAGAAVTPARKPRLCVYCRALFAPTSNAQKRCPACQAKKTPPVRPSAAPAKAKSTAARKKAPRAPDAPPTADELPTISVEASFNTGLLIRLLRAAATCLEALERGR